jgi:CubicO group peptidase (beta-lactamase class C family)
MASYLEAFNAEDPARLEAFLRGAFSEASLEERPLEARLGFHREVRGDHGPLEVLSVLESAATELTLEVRGAKSGERLRLGVAVEPEAPHYVLGFRIEMGGGDAPGQEKPVAGPPLSLTAARQAIDDELTAAGDEDRFSGVVLIRRGATAWYERAIGHANREAKVPNRLETRFNLGSIQKFFTKTLIARLCQDGKLRLADRLSDALPDYPNQEVAKKVTLQQLVDHRAGFGDFFGPAFDAAPRSVRSLRDYLGLFAARPLLFEPGTRSEYSNAGYIVLGLVIEAKTGLSYDEAVRRHVFEPAGMRSTSLDPIEDEAPDRAVGYWKPQGPKGAWMANRGVLPGKGSSAGGSYSTAGDLLRFVDALRADRLLSFGWTEWVLGGKAPASPAPQEPAVRHEHALAIAGGAEGLNAVLGFDTADGSATVVLANLDEPAAERTFRAVRAILERVK